MLMNIIMPEVHIYALCGMRDGYTYGCVAFLLIGLFIFSGTGTGMGKILIRFCPVVRSPSSVMS